MLMPNCSEATMRINLKNLSKEEIKGITNMLQELSDDETNDKPKYQDWWYDTGWENVDIFGIPIIEIKGDTPYNHYDDLIRYLKRLPYWDKVEYE